jgi:hypothetical protein
MLNRRTLAVLMAPAVLACAGDTPVEPDVPLMARVLAAPDISGTWHYAEETFLVVRPAGQVLHARCSSPDGVLTIQQDGATFTGTLTHYTGSCVLKDGAVVPPPWPLPYQAVLSGRIDGRSMRIDQYDTYPAPGAEPVHCPKNGTVHVTGGVAVGLSTVGRCDIAFEGFRPALATNSATATR